MRNQLVFAALATILAAAPAVAQKVPLTTVRVASGLSKPLYVTAPPGDFARVFIVERGGDIEILKAGAINAVPFLDITPLLITSDQEQGLLGLAFDPNYATNGFFYVDYTRAGDGATVIARYTVSANPDLADASSAVIMKTIAQPQSNHNGGCLQFGPDGYMYVGMGDGGNSNDTGAGHTAGTGNAQDGSKLLGKMLRLDVANPPTYVPASNPFVSDPLIADEIWDLGMRNPWRFSFDRTTGDLYIGDVGQGAREEIDFEPAGSPGGFNYGWRCMEGFNCTGLTGCTCNGIGITLPIKDYGHTAGQCSVTGGYVYRGTTLCGYDGTYFYADYCAGRIWTLKYSGGVVTEFTDRTAELAPGGGLVIQDVSSFGEDAAGDIYICDLFDNEVYKIVPSPVLVDCNLNGIQDGCDIANGTSFDANNDGIPDECQCPVAPAVYCTAKVNSQLCVPIIAFSGVPKVGSALPFNVTASEMLNKKSGLLFYGQLPLGAPFQGGHLCVKSPTKRTAVQNSGGSPTGLDCTGTYAYDFNVLIAAGTDPNLIAGNAVYAQYWARDNGFAAPNNTSLTDAVSFTICN
ncbi:MAG: PQQ-dependent sugar dehydrogenase [Planctomycetes bacterium]|nr:PQQ-dependent sugar dehydrogenase [Planctomycetota bacterium]